MVVVDEGVRSEVERLLDAVIDYLVHVMSWHGLID